MWLRVEIEITGASEVALDDFACSFSSLGCCGISFDDDFEATTDALQTGRRRLSLYFPLPPDREVPAKGDPLPSLRGESLLLDRIDTEIRSARQIMDCAEIRVVTSESLAEEDWSASWKVHIKTKIVTPRIRVRPSWERVEGGSFPADIVIDPGMAFGTADHATTALCLEALDRLYTDPATAPANILDLGCGTAILAITAVKLGAKQGVAVDIDPYAVEAAKKNIAANGLSSKITTKEGTIDDVADPFDLIVANLTSGILLKLAKKLPTRLAGNGALVLSGFYGEEEERIRSAYGEVGFEPVWRGRRDEWSCLAMSRPGRSRFPGGTDRFRIENRKT